MTDDNLPVIHDSELDDPLHAEGDDRIEVHKSNSVVMAIGHQSMEEWLRFEYEGFIFGEHVARP